MKILKDEIIQLKTNDINKLLELSEIEVVSGSSIRCKLKIWSHGFGYEGYVHFDEVSLFLKDLEKITTTLNGEAKIKEYQMDHYLKFTVTDLGHVFVSGYLNDYRNCIQNLKFEFETDQTSLLPFVNDLKRVITKCS